MKQSASDELLNFLCMCVVYSSLKSVEDNLLGSKLGIIASSRNEVFMDLHHFIHPIVNEQWIGAAGSNVHG